MCVYPTPAFAPTSSQVSPSRAIAAGAARDISDRTRQQLEAQIVKAFEKSLTLHEDGYRQSMFMPDGAPCLPGTVRILRPAHLVKGSEPAFYLCAIYLVNLERREADDWHYSCNCPFYLRTEQCLGRGQCKHGMWALRTFLSYLTRRPVVEHILSAVPPPPTPEPTREATRKVFARTPPPLPPGAITPPVPPTQPVMNVRSLAEITTALNRPIARTGEFD